MLKLVSLALFICSCSISAQSFDQAKLDTYLESLAAHDKAMFSLAVVEQGETVYQKSIGFADIESKQSANQDTQYRIGSITKVFTATMIFQLIDEGKLTLDTSLAKYYPKVKNAKKITISMLLSHRSGIHNLTNTPEYEQYMTRPKTKAEMVKIIEDLDSDFMPDSRANYSNSGYVLLGFILEDITKNSYAKQLQQRIVSPLNLNKTEYGGPIKVEKNQAKSYSHNTAGWSPAKVTDMSIPHGAGAIISTPTELAKFLSSLLTGKLISAESLAKMKELNQGFGRGLFQFPFHDKKAYGHNGGIDGFSSVAGYFAEGDVAFALTANGMNTPMNNISIGILSIYYGLTFDLPDFGQKPIELSEQELIKYEGVFSSVAMPLKITIKVNQGQLTAQATGQGALNLSAYSTTEFRFEQAGIVMIFGKKGDAVDYVTFEMQQGGRNFTFTRE